MQAKPKAPNSEVISAVEPDWSREAPVRFWDPFPRLLRTIRKYDYWDRKRGFLGKCMKRRWVISHTFWSFVTHADIPINCQIGGGLICMHPGGVVLHPDATIGPNCFLGPHVVIGVRSGPGAPTIEGNVNVGAGACILGAVTVGANSMIGANAVVIQDIDVSSIAVGIPARALSRPSDSIYAATDSTNDT